MKTTEVLKHFSSQVAVAHVLGISRAAVNKWGPTVPPLRQLQLQAITRGKLKPDRDVYEQLSKRHQRETACR